MNIRYLSAICVLTSTLLSSMACAPIDENPVATGDDRLTDGIVTAADNSAKKELENAFKNVSISPGRKPEQVLVVSYKAGWFGLNLGATAAVARALPSMKGKNPKVPLRILFDSVNVAVQDATIDLAVRQRELQAARMPDAQIQASLANAQRSNDAYTKVGNVFSKLVGSEAFTFDDGGIPAQPLADVIVGRLPSGNLLVVYRDLL
jgi:hypothetical protein